MQIRSINYSLHFERYTSIVYIGRYLVLIYMERFFSTVCCIFSYICWSVSYISWVSKFNNFFLTCTETEGRFIFQGFNIVLYRKFISNSSIPFWLCFIWSVNCSRDFLETLCQSVNCMSSVYEDISEMSSNVSINLYLRPCSIAIYVKFYLYCFTISDFFLVCKLKKSSL